MNHRVKLRSGGAPSAAHEARRDVLHTVSTLAGYTLELPMTLPDGSRPDVLRLSMTLDGLFIGEAKETESAQMVATQARLARYMDWLAAANEFYRHNVIAVSYRRFIDRHSWEACLQNLALDTGLVIGGLNSFSVSHDASITHLHLLGR